MRSQADPTAPGPRRDRTRALIDFLLGLVLFAACLELLSIYSVHQWHHTTRFVDLLLGH